MKRPRIALWIKWRFNYPMPWVKVCPDWLHLWAVRRVDKWHGERELVRLHGRIGRDYPRWHPFHKVSPDLTPEVLAENIRLSKERAKR